ncbi:MAG: TRAP transporter large permease [Lachnospiraceae bacterium]|mgnify:FL=1
MLGTLMLVLFLCLFATVPIALSLGISTLGVFATQFPSMPMANNLAQAMITSADSFPLMAIPFFMLVGTLMEKTGIARRLVDIASILTGDTPGGLGMAAIVASMFFAAISGSGPATAAAIGGIMLPAMIEQRYSRSYSVGIVSGASIIGPIIPPSIPMIMYGVTVGVSVTKMFTAGFIPGFMLGGGLCLYNYFVSKKRGYRGNTVTMTRKEKINTFKGAIPAILMPVIVLGGIYGGIFTPTECSVVGVVYTLLVGKFVYHELTLKKLKESLVEAAITSATIMIIFGPATTFGRLLTIGKIPTMVTDAMLSFSTNKYVIMLIINVLLLIIGMFIDTNSSIVLFAPLFVPILTSLGYDIYYVGVIMVVNLCIGMLTPPLGANLFVAMRIGNISLEEALKEAMPVIGVEILILAVMILCPWLITFLPNLLM